MSQKWMLQQEMRSVVTIYLLKRKQHFVRSAEHVTKHGVKYSTIKQRYLRSGYLSYKMPSETSHSTFVVVKRTRKDPNIGKKTKLT